MAMCGTANDWEQNIPVLTDDGLLLAEASHRVANEVSAALAAMHLVRKEAAGGGRTALLDAAIARLEGFGVTNRLLAEKPLAQVDLAEGLSHLCNALCNGRQGLENCTLNALLAPTMVDGTTARAIMMIAAELIQNAIRHALKDRAGSLLVTLDSCSQAVRLVIADDGPGLGSLSQYAGTGMGTPLIAELVSRRNGRMDCKTGRSGTVFRIELPRAESGHILSDGPAGRP